MGALAWEIPQAEHKIDPFPAGEALAQASGPALPAREKNTCSDSGFIKFSLRLRWNRRCTHAVVFA